MSPEGTRGGGACRQGSPRKRGCSRGGAEDEAWPCRGQGPLRAEARGVAVPRLVVGPCRGRWRLRAEAGGVCGRPKGVPKLRGEPGGLSPLREPRPLEGRVTARDVMRL